MESSTALRHPYPDSPEGRQWAEDLMCRTLYSLASWGFSLRPSGAELSGAFDAVAAAAAKHLKRTDASGLRLSAKRIEQIYRLWHDAKSNGWGEAKIGEGELVRGTFNSLQVHQMRARAPRQTDGMDVFALADKIIEHKGAWPPAEPPEDWCPRGDLELTAGAHRVSTRSRLRVSR